MLDLDAIVAQREEATGVDGGRVPFKWRGETYSFLDPAGLDDDKYADLEEVSSSNTETAILLMGEEQYDTFLENGGSAMKFGEVLTAYNQNVREHFESGKASRGNRSSRRMAERSGAKRR